MRPEDAKELHAVQERSYEKAGPGIRGSYPRSRAMDADRLAEFLGSKRYAVFATSRPDGRAHAAPVAFVGYGVPGTDEFSGSCAVRVILA